MLVQQHPAHHVADRRTDHEPGLEDADVERGGALAEVLVKEGDPKGDQGGSSYSR